MTRGPQDAYLDRAILLQASGRRDGAGSWRRRPCSEPCPGVPKSAHGGFKRNTALTFRGPPVAVRLRAGLPCPARAQRKHAPKDRPAASWEHHGGLRCRSHDYSALHIGRAAGWSAALPERKRLLRARFGPCLRERCWRRGYLSGHCGWRYWADRGDPRVRAKTAWPGQATVYYHSPPRWYCRRHRPGELQLSDGCWRCRCDC